MSHEYPSSVLITGGREAGGVSSFAEGLRGGFTELGMRAEIVPPARILRYGRDLRDPKVLKILSTSAIVAAPLARRAICVAHGCPCAAHLGWPRTLAILASYWMTKSSRGAQLAAVSDYAALHLRFIFCLGADAVIRNPVLPLFLEGDAPAELERSAMIYVGRLHRAKNVHRLLPAMADVLNENAGMRAWIAGAGPMRMELERAVAGDKRFEFLGALTAGEVRARLRRARVFISGCAHEALGIAYIEALSQGCAVAMPASGGGLEIAPELIGSSIQLFPSAAPREGVAAALRRALVATPSSTSFAAYSAQSVAEAYLAVDARFDGRGMYSPEAVR